MTLLDEARWCLEGGYYSSYIELFKDANRVFTTILFNDYYQTAVLDKPTLQERWEAYANTPQEWMRNYSSLIDIEALAVVDGIKVKTNLVDRMRFYADRGRQYDLVDIVEYIHQYEDDQAQEDYHSDEYYKIDYEPIDRKLPRGKISITQDMIDQWKTELISRKIGSFRNDW